MAGTTKSSMKSGDTKAVDLSKDLSDLKEMFAAQNEQHAKEVAELRGIITSMAADSASPERTQPESTENDIARERTESQRRAERTKKKLDKISQHVKEMDAYLERGEKQFTVQIPGNPERVVGGTNEFEVLPKYQTYFGITAILDPNKRPIVKEITGVVA